MKLAPTVHALRAPLQPLEAIRILAKAIRQNNEDSLKVFFHLLAQIDGIDSAVGLNPKSDALAYGMPTPLGAIDVVCLHADNTATLVVIRNGSMGHRHVLEGLGLAALHAVQARICKVGITSVRKALIFTSTGNLHTDTLLTQACIDAGVTPVVWQLFTTCVENLRCEMRGLAAELRMPTAERAEVAA